MRFQFLTYQNRWDTVTVWGLGGNRGWDRPTDYTVCRTTSGTAQHQTHRPTGTLSTTGRTFTSGCHADLPPHAAVARKLHSPVLWALGGP